MKFIHWRRQRRRACFLLGICATGIPCGSVSCASTFAFSDSTTHPLVHFRLRVDSPFAEDYCEIPTKWHQQFTEIRSAENSQRRTFIEIHSLAGDSNEWLAMPNLWVYEAA